MDEVSKEEEQGAITAQQLQRSVSMVFCQLSTDDQRRYNIASCNQVAPVYVGDGKSIPGERHLVVHERSGGPRTISYLTRELPEV